MSLNMENPELKRCLGLPSAIFIAVGMTVGGGVFVFTGLVFKISGQALPLAYALAVIPILISMMPLAMLGASLPSTGGSYRYPSRMVSPGLAFVGIWVYALASFFGQIPLYAIACAKYAQSIFPSINITVFAIILVSLFFLINLLGVKLAAQIQGILVIIMVSALCYYIFVGFSQLQPSAFSGFMDKGPGSLLLGTALLTFTYLGSNAIIELGGEIINPGKTIPRTFLIAIPLVAILYIGVAVATVGSPEIAGIRDSQEPLVDICREICSGTGLLFFILGGAVIALVTTLNALFLFGTRSLLIIVQDNILPRGLGKIHHRSGTPVRLLAGVWVLSVLGILSGLSLKTLASYAALGGLIIFLPMMAAAFRFPGLFPEQYARSEFKLAGIKLLICVITGTVLVLFFSLVLLVDLETPLNVGFFVLFLLSGIIYYQFRKRWLAGQGIDLNEIINNREGWHAAES